MGCGPQGCKESDTTEQLLLYVCVLLGTFLMQEKEDLTSAGRIREGSEETPELGHKAGGRMPGAGLWWAGRGQNQAF